MILAVDIGTSEFRTLIRDGQAARSGGAGRLVGRRSAACYIAIPSDPVAEKWIRRLPVRVLECEGSRIVLGDSAIELARVLRVPLIPLLVEGRLPLRDPIGRQLVAISLESLVPPRAAFDEVLMTIPGDDIDPDSPEGAFLSRLFRLQSQTVRIAHSGTALAHSLLRSSRYTGLVINLGAAYCSISLTRLGQPLMEITAAVGGRWIDDRLARSRSRFVFDAGGQRFLDIPGIEAWKRTVDLRSSSKGNPDLAILADLHREVARSIAAKIEGELAVSRRARRFSEAVPVLLAGGGGAMGGFDELVRAALSEISLPFAIRDVETVGYDSFAVARGLLIARELGHPGLLKRTA